VKSSVVQFAFIVLSLAVGAAVEDMLPPVFGLGIPVLLGVAVFFAVETRAPVWLFAAVAAGALEESVAVLPPATAIVFFVALATAVRFFREPLAWILASYPAYQVWIGLVADGSGAVSRIVFSLPVGAFALAVVVAALSVSWRKAGADA
jgi:hypothetical protein